MESPRKFNDCYFYYYSTCTKGDNCVFRHEPSALGCETMCPAWQQGKCLDKKCKLRHMELRKNRKQIPCYWENQPGGCRKKHCPFMHKNPEARTDGIAPSQAIPASVGAPLAAPVLPGVAGVAGEVPPVPAVPVSLLWQQQRQVVLDSAILGVLPTGEVARRPLPPHAEPYSVPVDPLVVNFDEESDNESAPSSTPVKQPPDDPPPEPQEQKSQELLLLEKIQAEAAAYYNYSDLPPVEPKDRKLVRTNLNNKYDRLSLDELTGRKISLDKNSLDFKVMSLDEIRAKKRSSIDATANPITLTLSRKRKISETVIESGNNKIIKVVRSNSVVYRKVDTSTNATPTTPVVTEQKPVEVEIRKRTISDCDILELQDDDLYDDCFRIKKTKVSIDPTSSKPLLIRSKSFGNEEKTESEKLEETQLDSDSEVQVVSEELIDPINTEVIELDDKNETEILTLSDEDEEDILISDCELGLGKNVPDVVASCKLTANVNESDDLDNINEIIDDDL